MSFCDNVHSFFFLFFFSSDTAIMFYASYLYLFTEHDIYNCTLKTIFSVMTLMIREFLFHMPPPPPPPPPPPFFPLTHTLLKSLFPSRAHILSQSHSIPQTHKQIQFIHFNTSWSKSSFLTVVVLPVCPPICVFSVLVYPSLFSFRTK